MENLVAVSWRGGSGWNWMILFTARSFAMIRAAAALTFSMSICGGSFLMTFKICKFFEYARLLLLLMCFIQKC